MIFSGIGRCIAMEGGIGGGGGGGASYEVMVREAP